MDDLVSEYRGLRFTLHRVDASREQFVVTRVSDGHMLASKLYVAEVRDFFGAAVDAWIADRLGVNEPEPVCCGSCGATLVAVADMDTDYQFDNALWVRFSGGYSMFIDPCGDPDPQVVLCHACAHEFCDALPWVARLLEPARSHAHLSAEGAALIAAGHDGWDLASSRLDGGVLLDRHLVEKHGVKEMPADMRERWALHYQLHAGSALGHHHSYSFDGNDDDDVEGVGPI
jgi:hypothetical protein